MKEQEQLDYDRIAEAIGFIRSNFRRQPGLDEVASQIHLSPFHFQKLFTDWAGTSPKKFLQFITLEHAKKMLKETRANLFDTAFESGLSGTSRLHDLFVSVEGMTPAEYRHGGRELNIHYSFAESPFGNLLIASTEKGVCAMSFYSDEAKALGELKSKFPEATFRQKLDLHQQHALFIFQNDRKRLDQIKLHLKGTPFQLKVWEALLRIPLGGLTTYGEIAQKIGKPKAARAVGTAIGSNPVAFLIPCHRVIQSGGESGGYEWGPVRKTAIIGWEAAQIAGSL